MERADSVYNHEWSVTWQTPVWEEMTLNIFLSNCTRIWEKDMSSNLFHGLPWCFIAQDKWSQLGYQQSLALLRGHISLTLLLSTLDCPGLLPSMTHLCLWPCLTYFIINSSVSWSWTALDNLYQHESLLSKHSKVELDLCCLVLA